MALRQFHRFLKPVTVGTIFCLAASLPASASEILRRNLDKADTMGTIVVSDQEVKFKGKGSIRVSTKWPTTICLDQISGLNLENVKLVYQAKIKSEDLEGAAFLEMWCKVGTGQYFSRGLNSTVSGTQDWQTVSTAFILNKGQKAQVVTLNLVVNGIGTVWVDDIQLVDKPLK